MALMNIDRKLINDFIEVSHRLRLRGFTTGGGGGISIRIANTDKLLIKGWEIASEDLREEEISLVDIHGNQLNNMKPCLETSLHLEVLKTRMDLGSVIHAHPPHATAFGNLKPKMGEARIKHYGMLRRAVFTPYADPGSKELANLVATAFQQKDVLCVLMEDHGVTVAGKDVYDAYYRLDMLEGYAKSFLLTLLLEG
jgi:ribulose-5-phosphate 4-epimerase/fuculose-1-phosphate aldolase